ncbi:MAG TPA: BatD family protein [Candidatus Limnocylindria bacterium]|nr:BatD family protein [Candidatus Limnocylindria bacterium]
MRTLALALVVLISLGSPASADGPVTVSSTIDRDVITIGDPVVLALTVELAPGWTVADPGVPRALGEFEILETEPAQQTRLNGGVTRFVFRYRMSAYRVGEQELPPIEVSFAGPGGATGTASTTRHVVRVQSVILPEENAQDIKPLKPQLPLPGLLASELMRLVFAAAGAVAVVLLVLFALWYFRRRNAPVPDGLTPAQRALAELEKLAALQLPDKGRYTEHYERMTAILRAYVAEQYRLPAGERTPRELRVEMERAGVDPQQRAAIFEILREGEVVRFHSGKTYPAHARNALGSALSAMQRAAASEQYAVATVRADP